MRKEGVKWLMRAGALAIVGIMILIGHQRVFAEATYFETFRAETLAKLGEVPRPAKPLKIGAILITLANPFWVTVKEGYENTSKELAVTIDVQAAPQENSIAGQLDLLENMVVKGYDALTVHAITPQNVIPGLAKARAKGIPVVTDKRVDIKAAREAGADPIEIALVDFYGQGRTGGAFLAARVKAGGGGRVAFIEGLPGAPQSEARKNGAIEAFKAEPSVNLVAVQPGNWDRMKAYSVASNLLQAHPDLKGIMCANDVMALAAVEAVEAAGKQGRVAVVGIDLIPQARDAIKAGRLAGSVAQSPFLVGEMCARAAILSALGRPVPLEAYIPIVLVSRENIARMDGWK
ncbi:MAG TPA: substrate-binding domain-containing protein [Syntrophobacter fumaroxidans]|nr:substrate-binding domain-containing protein [Syntrophobacter fumaroxidans]